MSAPELNELPDDELNMDYFKASLKEYLKLDEEIKTLAKALRQRRDKQVNLSQALLLFLNKNEINQVQLEGTYAGQELVPNKQNRVKNPNATSIMDIIKSKLADNQELLKSITDEIDAHKETIEVEKVKISKVKAAKRPTTKPTATESALSTALLMNLPQ